MKRKVGRPVSEDTKHKSLTIRISDDMHRRLLRYASEHEMTMTAVALQALEKELSDSEVK